MVLVRYYPVPVVDPTNPTQPREDLWGAPLTFLHPDTDAPLTLVDARTGLATANPATATADGYTPFVACDDGPPEAKVVDQGGTYTNYVHSLTGLKGVMDALKAQNDTLAGNLTTQINGKQPAGDYATVAAVAEAKDRGNHSGTQKAETIEDLANAVRSVVQGMLVAGDGVGLAYDAETGKLTVTSTGGTADDAVPVAAFTYTTSGLEVVVDGSASVDPDSTITSWSWTFGDGATATGVTAAHTYAAASSYPVTLTVTSDTGQTSTATSRTVTVTADSAPPPAEPDFTRVRQGNVISPYNTTISTLTVPLTTTTPGGATAGNLIVGLVVLDKDAGSFTAQTGWNLEVARPGASVSMAFAWKIAVGGEVGVPFAWGTPVLGGQGWAGEYASVTGFTSAPLVFAPAYSDTSTSTRDVGPLGPTSSLGLALTALGIDSDGGITPDAPAGFTTLLQSVDTHGGNSPLTVGEQIDVPAGSTLTGTYTWDFPDQAYGMLLIFQASDEPAPVTDLDLSFDTSLIGWTAEPNTELLRITEQVHAGAGAMRMEAIAAGEVKAYTVPIAVDATKLYTVTGQVRSAAVSRSMAVQVDWYSTTAATPGDYLSSNHQYLPTTPGSWEERAISNVQPPANAVAMRIVAVAAVSAVYGTPAAGEQHDVDSITYAVTGDAPPPAPAGVLWETLFTGTNPYADLKLEVEKFPERVSFPVVSGSPDGQVMQISHNAGQSEPGYKGRSRFYAASGLSGSGEHLNIGEQDVCTLIYQVYVSSSLRSNVLEKSSSKWPGLLGTPDHEDGWHASTGGTLNSDSYSSRIQVVKGSDYSGGSAYLLAYVYATHAAGISYASNPMYGSTKYGIWVPFTPDLSTSVSSPMSERNVRVPVDRWFELAMEVGVNTPGANDGTLRCWLDDTLYVDIDDVQWRKSGINTRINQIDWSTFVSNNAGDIVGSNNVRLARVQITGATV